MNVFSDRTRHYGFTLIEVLVALVVVSLGTMAVAGQIGQAARNARLVQVKTFGSWIAMNKVTELRLVEGLPDAGRDNGEIEFAGREWVWESEIKAPSAEVQNFMRIDVTVALAEEPEAIIADAIGFAGVGGNPSTVRPFDVRAPIGGAPGTPGDDVQPIDPGVEPAERR